MQSDTCSLILLMIIFIQVPKYLLSTYYAPGTVLTVLGTGDMAMSKTKPLAPKAWLLVCSLLPGRQEGRILSVYFISLFP